MQKLIKLSTILQGLYFVQSKINDRNKKLQAYFNWYGVLLRLEGFEKENLLGTVSGFKTLLLLEGV